MGGWDEGKSGSESPVGVCEGGEIGSGASIYFWDENGILGSAGESCLPVHEPRAMATQEIAAGRGGSGRRENNGCVCGARE